MIIARAEGQDGIPLLIIGLSRENMEALLKGKPIIKDPRDMDIGVALWILGAETEDALVAEVRKYLPIPEDKIIDKR